MSSGSADGINGFPGGIEIPIDPIGPISASNFFFYQYRDPSWGDVLTRYNGSSITYDANGNPLSYKGNTLSWQDGKNLASIAFAGGGSASYVYDCNGIRTEKTVNGVQHKYYTKESVLLAESFSGKVLEFIYDEQSLPVGLVLTEGNTSTKYYFAKSIQGDVMALIAENGTIVARYDYDAYGKLLSVTDASGAEITDPSHIANINPIRYRGYYFDSETGFYYLNSRYYDPEICRFISPDDASLLGANGTIPSYNLYAYCENNPVNCVDVNGDLTLEVAFAVLGAVAGGAIGGAFVSSVSYLVHSSLNGEAVTSDGLRQAAIDGAISGAVGAAIGAISIASPFSTAVLKFVASAAYGGYKVSSVEDNKCRVFLETTCTTFVGSLVPFFDKSYGYYGNIFTNLVGSIAIGTGMEATCTIVNQTSKPKATAGSLIKRVKTATPINRYIGYIHGRTFDPNMC